jgi:N-acetylglucosamine-6-phosphate deacetylase
MPALHHREPGVLGAVLDRGDVDCELICDGVHVAPPMCRLVHRAKGPNAVHLVTDSMQAAGMPDGDYRLGGASVTVSRGRALLAGGGSIAGSTLTMDGAVANAVDFLGVSVPEAVALASARPAALLGIADVKGALAPGYDADMVVLDDGLRACGTMVDGRWVVAPGAR